MPPKFQRLRDVVNEMADLLSHGQGPGLRERLELLRDEAANLAAEVGYRPPLTTEGELWPTSPRATSGYQLWRLDDGTYALTVRRVYAPAGGVVREGIARGDTDAIERWRARHEKAITTRGREEAAKSQGAAANAGPAPAGEDEHPYIEHRDAVAMLRLRDDPATARTVDARTESRMMARIRERAGASLRAEKKGNRWRYHTADWLRVVELIRKADSVDRWLDQPDPSAKELEEMEEEKKRIRKRPQ